MPTITQLPSSKVPITETNSGVMTPQWYRYFFNLYDLTKSGSLVISVTATPPLLSSGGIAPNLSIPPATAIAGGYLTASDWNTFYAKANSGTNSDITSLTGLTGGIATPDFISFDTTPETVPTAPGSLYWDAADGNQTLSLIMANSDAVQQIGEETYYRIKASSAITEGQVVMFTGTVGASGALTGAPATGLTAATASYIMGVATQSIALNGWGYVTHFGLVRGLNTNAWVDGTILYYDPTVTGGLTSSIPAAPNAKVQVCAVVYQSASNGSLFIRPAFGGLLGQYEGDVQVTSPAASQILTYTSSNRWENSYALYLISTTTAAAFKTPNIKEVMTISATAATGTVNYDITTQSALYYTTNASGNFTVNLRGSSGTTLNTVMNTGEVMTVTFLVTNGATAYYNNVIQVDGTTSGVTTKWLGGTAPTSGNVNAIDVYTYAVIKTGSATFTVLASQTKAA